MEERRNRFSLQHSVIQQQAGLKIDRGSAEWPKWWQAWWHSPACIEDTCFVHMSSYPYCSWETTVVFFWSDIQTTSLVWRRKPVYFHLVYKLLKSVSRIKIFTLTSLYFFPSLEEPKALASVKVNVRFPGIWIGPLDRALTCHLFKSVFIIFWLLI